MRRYWYAVGYYDGRAKGEFDASMMEYANDSDYQAYKEGYDCGVADYCRIELGE